MSTQFLNFRLNTGDLKDPDTEHYRYQSELNTLSKYYTKESEIGKKVLKLQRDFKVIISFCLVALAWNTRTTLQVECLHGLLCGWNARRGKGGMLVRSSFWVECSYELLCGWNARRGKGGMLRS
jgi:hypothetical protein